MAEWQEGTMVDVGLSANDLKRVIWSAIFGALAAYGAGVHDARALWGAAIAAACSAIKNGILGDGSSLKG